MKELNDLYEKYKYPVPRYTSYPPATQFKDGYIADSYKSAIIQSNQHKPQNISVYVHIPFCKKLCHYCGCNSLLMKDDDRVGEYIEAVKTEINNVFALIDKSRKLSQIHFGGGTPNAIDHHYLGEIVNLIRSKVDSIEFPEIAIETNPAYLDYDYIQNLLDIGFNRFSFGIQDFNLEVLKYANRDSTVLPMADIFKFIKDRNPKASINLDFIYGLPGQTTESFLETMKTAAELKPDRLVTFSYAHVPWVNKNQIYLEKIGLPDPHEKMEMFAQSYELLKSFNYKPLGLDHFVLETDELYESIENYEVHRNFQGYCTRRTTGQVYGFGCSSISQLEMNYVQNVKMPDDYINLINQTGFAVWKGYDLSNEELIIRDTINYFMCNNLLDFDRISEMTNKSIDEILNVITFNPNKFDEFEQDGLIERKDGKIYVTEYGVIFIRNIAASLDPNFEEKENQYSRSV